MRKINESYLHEETGMTFDIEYEEKVGNLYLNGETKIVTKKVKIMPSAQSGWVRGDKGFVFNRSKPETIKMIGKALLEIGEFVEKL